MKTNDLLNLKASETTYKASDGSKEKEKANNSIGKDNNKIAETH